MFFCFVILLNVFGCQAKAAFCQGGCFKALAWAEREARDSQTVRQSDSHGCVIWSFGALVLDVSRFQDFEDTERQAVVKRLGLPVHKARKT